MRERLLARVGEAAALARLAGLQVNYDPARAPEHGTVSVQGHWHVDSAATACWSASRDKVSP